MPASDEQDSLLAHMAENPELPEDHDDDSDAIMRATMGFSDFGGPKKPKRQPRGPASHGGFGTGMSTLFTIPLLFLSYEITDRELYLQERTLGQSNNVHRQPRFRHQILQQLHPSKASLSSLPHYRPVQFLPPLLQQIQASPSTMRALTRRNLKDSAKPVFH